MRRLQWIVFTFASLFAVGASAEPPPIEAFAARQPVEDAAISPDGRYLALVQAIHGRGVLLVVDRHAPAGTTPKVVMGEPDQFHFRWCGFVSDVRLLCSYWTSVLASGRMSGRAYNTTRLVGVDVDGGNMKVLLQDSRMVAGDWLDGVIHWHPGPPDTVLIQAPEGMEASEATRGTTADIFGRAGTNYQVAVFELNTRTGAMKVRQHGRSPISSWIVDAAGEVRVGFAMNGTVATYYARLEGDKDWRRLSKFEVFSREQHFEPVAMSSDDPNKAYAFAASDGRQALWLIDLTERTDPELVFAHPAVAVGAPFFGRDGRLIGVRYETELPHVNYVDARARAVMKAVDRARPNTFNGLAGAAEDHATYLIRSYSDVEPPTYSLFDTTNGHLSRISSPPAELPAAALARMTAISYPARDGTPIPGYLSRPHDAPAGPLPLVVMPHGGPIARDDWGWFFLRQFLASRGYAVLQMNFRGSWGYSADWFFSAHQDWGGLTYDDVVDGARWAIKEGIADPRRICIVGWSFGGYLALLGAQRDKDLFRCSVSIAGVSDLGMLVDEHYYFTNFRVVAEQVGTDAAKLRRDSPRLHAAEFGVPVLMVHGTMDAVVPVEHAEKMDAALASAGKAHRLVLVPKSDHSLSGEGDRVTLMREVEAFLKGPLGPPAAATP